MTQHTVADCRQNPVLESSNNTIDRWVKRMDRQDSLMERQTAAMESIMAQGEQIKFLTQSTSKHDTDIEAAFKAIRRIDLRHAVEDGEEKVEERQQKFWDGVKQQFTDKALVGLLFIWWLSDKFHIPTTVARWLKEFKG